MGRRQGGKGGGSDEWREGMVKGGGSEGGCGGSK